MNRYYKDFSYTWIILVVVCLVASSEALAARIYVDRDANGANDGSSWADACNHLQDALAAATSGDVIWVAEGIYKPDQGAAVTLGDREATFQLKNGVAIYGGFAGGETSRDQRDTVTNETLLSGDLAGDDAPVADPRDLLDEPTRAENIYHVVTGSGTDANAILDGFTITAGNANGSDTYDQGGGMYSSWKSSPTLTNCTFSGNAAGADPITTAGDDGGGMYSLGDPTLTNCMFSGNAAGDDGGGMCSRVGSPTLTNCTFTGNSAQSSGGGMYNRSGSQKLTNCTFTGNSASPFAYGGGMYNGPDSNPIVTNCTFSGNSAGLTGGIHNAWYSYLTLTNCILWSNSDPGGMGESAQVSTSGPQIPLINYCCIQGWTGTGSFSGTDNIGDDPLFVDADGPDDNAGTEDDNLRLSAGSPCIDAGDNTAVPPDTDDLDDDGNKTEPIPLDLAGQPRFVDDLNTNDTGNGTPPIVDMGAYEFIADGGTTYHPADTDSDYVIDDFELLDYIDLWADGQVEDFDLLDAIDLWAAGHY